MRLAVSLFAATAALASVGVTADAAPVAQSRLARTAFTLTGSDGVQQRVDLTVTTATSPRLTLQVSTCDRNGCDSPDYFEARIAPSAIRIDPATALAELRTTLGGRALRIVWTPDERPAVHGGTEGSGDDSGETLSVYRAEPALARIFLGEDSCTTGGGVGDEIRLENPEGSGATTQPLSTFGPSVHLGCSS